MCFPEFWNEHLKNGPRTESFTGRPRVTKEPVLVWFRGHQISAPHLGDCPRREREKDFVARLRATPADAGQRRAKACATHLAIGVRPIGDVADAGVEWFDWGDEGLDGQIMLPLLSTVRERFADEVAADEGAVAMAIERGAKHRIVGRRSGEEQIDTITRAPAAQSFSSNSA